MSFLLHTIEGQKPQSQYKMLNLRFCKAEMISRSSLLVTSRHNRLELYLSTTV